MREAMGEARGVTWRWRRARMTYLIALALTVSPRASDRARDVIAREPPAQAPAQPATVAGTGVIAGQTIDAVTGQPVANTLLGLSQRVGSGAGTQNPVAANTKLVLVLADAQGRFVVRDVPKGSFLLLATAPGYIVSNYGQGRAAGPTRTIDMADGERRTTLTIRLFRHAVIAGTVTDEAGEPVVGVTVRALRRAANGPGGEVRYMRGTEAVTDDRGKYRLTSLTPGQFLVSVPETQVTVPASVVDGFLQSVAGRGGGSAGARLLDLMSSGSTVPSAGAGVRVDDMLLQSSGGGRLLTMPPPAGDGALSVYPTVVYSASDATPPTPLTLAAGEERPGIDFHLVPVGTVRVSGTVMAEGAPAANVGVRLVRADGQVLQNDSDFEAAASITAADGTFTLLGVAPGKYVLKALRTRRLTLPTPLATNPAIVAAYGESGPTPGTAPAVVGAQAPMSVGSRDLRDVVVSLRPGATVSGQVVFEAGATPPTAQQLQAMGILLTSEDGGIPGGGLMISRVSATGTFKITAPGPGRYLVTALAVPAGWRAVGIQVAGRPLTGPLDLTGDDVGDVSLTYTTRVAQIAGTVRTATGAPMTSAEVVVFPVDRRLWTQEPLNPRQPRIEQAANTGVFMLPGVLPGEYFLAAVDEADVPETPGPAFFAAVSTFATRLTVGADEKRSQDLTVGRIK